MAIVQSIEEEDDGEVMNEENKGKITKEAINNYINERQ
jgi:hypothetical protein